MKRKGFLGLFGEYQCKNFNCDDGIKSYKNLKYVEFDTPPPPPIPDNVVIKNSVIKEFADMEKPKQFRVVSKNGVYALQKREVSSLGEYPYTILFNEKWVFVSFNGIELNMESDTIEELKLKYQTETTKDLESAQEACNKLNQPLIIHEDKPKDKVIVDIGVGNTTTKGGG